jgi:hypothetical protein
MRCDPKPERPALRHSRQGDPESEIRLKWRALNLLAATVPGGRGAGVDGPATGMTDGDEVAAGFFAERLIGILNGGALALMLSIGHRTGCSRPWPGCRHRARAKSRPRPGCRPRPCATGWT